MKHLRLRFRICVAEGVKEDLQGRGGSHSFQTVVTSMPQLVVCHTAFKQRSVWKTIGDISRPYLKNAFVCLPYSLAIE